MQPEVWFERLRQHRVPSHLHDGLVNYLAHHKRPGSFLTHVLENDLRGAVSRADETSAAGLPQIVRFLVNCAPAIAWGSAAEVDTWIAAGAESEEVTPA